MKRVDEVDTSTDEAARALDELSRMGLPYSAAVAMLPAAISNDARVSMAAYRWAAQHAVGVGSLSDESESERARVTAAAARFVSEQGEAAPQREGFDRLFDAGESRMQRQWQEQAVAPGYPGATEHQREIARDERDSQGMHELSGGREAVKRLAAEDFDSTNRSPFPAYGGLDDPSGTDWTRYGFGGSV